MNVDQAVDLFLKRCAYAVKHPLWTSELRAAQANLSDQDYKDYVAAHSYISEQAIFSDEVSESNLVRELHDKVQNEPEVIVDIVMLLTKHYYHDNPEMEPERNAMFAALLPNFKIY